MNVPCKASFITTSCAVLFLCNRNFLVHNKKIHKNRRKYVRLESYFLLKHAIQWTAPPEYSSVSFQSYLLYFCTAAQFLCFCNGLFLLYSNERFFAFRTSYVLLCFCTSGTFSLVSQLTFSVDRTSLSSDFQLLPVFSIRLFLCWMLLYECFSFVCLYYNSFCVFVNTFFYKNINFCKILHFWYFFQITFLSKRNIQNHHQSKTDGKQNCADIGMVAFRHFRNQFLHDNIKHRPSRKAQQIRQHRNNQ